MVYGGAGILESGQSSLMLGDLWQLDLDSKKWSLICNNNIGASTLSPRSRSDVSVVLMGAQTTGASPTPLHRPGSRTSCFFLVAAHMCAGVAEQRPLFCSLAAALAATQRHLMTCGVST